MKKIFALAVILLAISGEADAQSILHRADSILTAKYRKGGIDTAYITRPATKWTVTARMNVSGAKIETVKRQRGHSGTVPLCPRCVLVNY
jgi:hypothetical protein